MKKDWLLVITSSVLAILIALGLIRWLAPQLLGSATDMQLVQVDKKVPPFYEGIFRKNDLSSTKFILKDPNTRVRAKPFFPDAGGIGPNDLLGFRNSAVPNVADVVVIGDSQTYGNNAYLGKTWPGQLSDFLDQRLTVYSMAVGGWGAVQYLDMFSYATIFQPKVVVVAFYSGNDSLESYSMAYGVEKWKMLIPDPDLTASDAPKVTFPAPKSQWWAVKFLDGVKTVFTPTLRLGSNQEHPAVRAGYKIMGDVAKRITEMAKPRGVHVVFTIIPTKELVYAKKIEIEKLEAPMDYKVLVDNERKNIHMLADSIRSLPGATYVDLVGPLQKAAIGAGSLYLNTVNGHPVEAGYRVISQEIAKEIKSSFSPLPQGLVAVFIGGNKVRLAFVEGGSIRYFKSAEVVKNNGWTVKNIPMIKSRDVASLKVLSDINEVNPARYGPK